MQNEKIKVQNDNLKFKIDGFAVILRSKRQRIPEIFAEFTLSEVEVLRRALRVILTFDLSIFLAFWANGRAPPGNSQSLEFSSASRTRLAGSAVDFSFFLIAAELAVRVSPVAK